MLAHFQKTSIVEFCNSQRVSRVSDVPVTRQVRVVTPQYRETTNRSYYKLLRQNSNVCVLLGTLWAFLGGGTYKAVGLGLSQKPARRLRFIGGALL